MSTDRNKTTITRLEGLVERYTRMLHEIEEAAAELLGVERDEFGTFGHVSDFVWSGEPDVNALLRKLDIRVDEAGVRQGAD